MIEVIAEGGVRWIRVLRKVAFGLRIEVRDEFDVGVLAGSAIEDFAALAGDCDGDSGVDQVEGGEAVHRFVEGPGPGFDHSDADFDSGEASGAEIGEEGVHFGEVDALGFDGIGDFATGIAFGFCRVMRSEFFAVPDGDLHDWATCGYAEDHEEETDVRSTKSRILACLVFHSSADI